MKHTPGPWKIGHIDRVINYIPIYARIGVTQLACIAKTDGHEVGFGIAQAEMQANARLIASAPDLCEALEQIADDKGPATFSVAEMQLIARNAIQKAKEEA